MKQTATILIKFTLISFAVGDLLGLLDIPLFQKPTITVKPRENLKNYDRVTIEWCNIETEPEDRLGMLCEQPFVSNKWNRLYKITPLINNSQCRRTKISVFYYRSDCLFMYLKLEKGNQYVNIATSEPIKFIYNVDHPFGIHLSFTSNPDEIRVMWGSGSKDNNFVNYGTDSKLSKISSAETTTYTAATMCGPPASSTGFMDPGYLHDALIINLQPDTEYYYSVGNDAERSVIYSFRTRTSFETTDFRTSMVVFGDLSTDKPTGPYQTLKKIGELRDDDNPPDFILHAGDISYARGQAYIWDIYMDMIESVACNIPIKVAIGNHEHLHKIGHEKDPSDEIDNIYPTDSINFGSGGECSVPMVYRFHMPDNGNKLFWYSFNYGLVHTIVLTSEINMKPDSRQYLWLIRDLDSVNRKVTPWVIVSMHRPMYSSIGGGHPMSKYLKSTLEPLFLQYKVNFLFNGHTHIYERTCAIFNDECVDILETKTKWGVFYITVGSGGMRTNKKKEKEYSWSKMMQRTYGFGKLDFLNKTHAVWKFYGSTLNQVLDKTIFINPI